MREYRGWYIEHTLTGWWVARTPGSARLMADTLGGLKALIRHTMSTMVVES